MVCTFAVVINLPLTHSPGPSLRPCSKCQNSSLQPDSHFIPGKLAEEAVFQPVVGVKTGVLRSNFNHFQPNPVTLLFCVPVVRRRSRSSAFSAFHVWFGGRSFCFENLLPFFGPLQLRPKNLGRILSLVLGRTDIGIRFCRDRSTLGYRVILYLWQVLDEPFMDPAFPPVSLIRGVRATAH